MRAASRGTAFGAEVCERAGTSGFDHLVHETDMTTPTTESDAELLTRVAELLDTLGPVSSGATRAEKWRTTDQLANELRLFKADDVDRLDRVLREHEAQGIERMEAGMAPERVVRRAKYPDRTTALPLWGSTNTNCRGQPWIGHRPDRTDRAEDLPPELAVPAGAPRVFLSHTHEDASIAVSLAKDLATMSVGSWRFEADIEHGHDIAHCVRAAITESDALVMLVSRSSIASLWILTEMHTARSGNKAVVLVVNTEDTLLLQLLESAVFQYPDEDFDQTVHCDTDVMQLLMEDYERGHTESRNMRYVAQAKDFMATLPTYLGSIVPGRSRVWRSMLAFPRLPPQWKGFLEMEPLSELPGRLERRPELPASPIERVP